MNAQIVIKIPVYNLKKQKIAKFIKNLKMINNVSIKNVLRIKQKFIFFKEGLKCFTKIKYDPNLYPYAFEGLKKIQFKHNQLAFKSINQIFPSDTLQGFKDGYRCILNLLASKDEEGLNDLCHPGLTRDLNFKDVKLVNPMADIQVVCGPFFIVFGDKFLKDSKRQKNVIVKQMDKYNKFYFTVNRDWKQMFNLFQVYKQRTIGTPTLINFQIFFKTKMKLVQKGCLSHSQIDQIHSINFEVDGYLKYSILNRIMDDILYKDIKEVNLSQMMGVLKTMLGNKYQWRIDKIDRLKDRLQIQQIQQDLL